MYVMEHGMEFGWFFVEIFAILIAFGVFHSVTFVGGRKKTRRGSPLGVLKG